MTGYEEHIMMSAFKGPLPYAVAGSACMKSSLIRRGLSMFVLLRVVM